MPKLLEAERSEEFELGVFLNAETIGFANGLDAMKISRPHKKIFFETEEGRASDVFLNIRDDRILNK